MKKENKKKILLVGIGAIGVCGLGYVLRKYHVEINDLKGDIDILRYNSELDGIAIDFLLDLTNCQSDKEDN